MILEEAIVDLLLRHNCVVVPAFGGFIAQSTSATIDMRTGVMLPPRKSVLFNRQLINNDGLLISHLSNEGAMGYEGAEKYLKKHVSDWHHRLKEGQRVSIDKIGHLYLDAERNISFEQDRFFNLLLQSYGLNKVHFITEEEVKIAEYQHRPEKVNIPLPIIEETIDFSPREIPVPESLPKQQAKVIELKEEEPVVRRRVWKYAVAAALLPIAFYTYWIPMRTNVLESGMISFKDFNPMYHSAEGVYQKKSFSFPESKEKGDKTLSESIEKLSDNVEVYSYKYDDDLFIPVRLKDEVKMAPIKVEKTESELLNQSEIVVENKVKPVASASSGPQYIVGCFSSADNAESMVDLLKSKGFNARIVDTKGGLTRVSAGGSDNMVEMDSIENKAIAAGFKGWILK
ncbi:MAG: SPOR domain-containing protein [Bacteroidota bacterium]